MLKKVQFLRTATFYQSKSSTPSPSLSVSSLPSSSSLDLQTPPPEEEDSPTIIYPVTPFTKQEQLDPPSPEMNILPKPMQIHFLLAFSPFTGPAITWDVSYPPPTSSFCSEDEQELLSSQILEEPATCPPLPSLNITHPDLKYAIEVLPKDPTPGAIVSVNDVFTTIFKELRLAIHPLDYAELPEGDVRSAVDSAYFERCGRIPDPQIRSLELMKGIKKIDLLMGRTTFLGLSGTLTAPDTWELNIL